MKKLWYLQPNEPNESPVWHCIGELDEIIFLGGIFTSAVAKLMKDNDLKSLHVTSDLDDVTYFEIRNEK